MSSDLVFEPHNCFKARYKELAQRPSTDPISGSPVVYRTFRYFCGRPVDCPGLLGHLSTDPEKQPDPSQVYGSSLSAYGPGNFFPLIATGDLERALWEEPTQDDLSRIITHEKGYWWDEDNLAYRVCSGKKPRRKVPELLRYNNLAREEQASTPNGLPLTRVVGEFPWLPAIIMCSVCGLANRVDLPDLKLRR
jgi:hypothetical protein